MPKSIIMTGGGTAGHVMPNLALIPYLRQHFDEFHYIGSENGVEKDIIAAHSFIKYHEIPCIKLIRSLSPKNLKIPFVLLSGISHAKKIIKEVQPSVIFSKGGYVALPVVKASGRIATICHESDISLGLANKLSAKKCIAVCASFSNAAESVKNGIHTGAPIRNSLYSGKRLDLKLNHNLPVLLIMGGSLGARAINECIKESLERLLCKYNVIHIAGRGNIFSDDNTINTIAASSNEKIMTSKGIASSVVKNRTAANASTTKGIFHQYEFVSNIEDYFFTADLVVSRGGSGSMFELMALQKRALIIPLPKGNSRGDQVENARYFEKLGCCHVLEQHSLSTQSLLEKLDKLENDKSLISNIAKIGNIDGTKKIAEIIISATKG